MTGKINQQRANTQKNSHNIVLRLGINIYGRYLKSIESKITPNCIQHVTSDTYLRYVSKFNNRPMFSRFYMVYADMDSLDKVDKKYIDFLLNCSITPWVVLVVQTRIKETFDQLHFIKGFSDFQFLDCYNLSKDTLNAYIRAELLSYGASADKITEDSVNRIRKRVRYKEYVLDTVLPQLACTELSVKDINRLISPYSGVTLNNFGRCFFDPKKSKPVSEIMCNYRKYPDTIYKSVMEYINSWCKFYDIYVTGEFCEDSILQWIDSSGSKYGIAYEYQARKWLTALGQYSYDFMMFAYIQLQPFSNSSASEKMNVLYKVYRMVNNG